MTSEPPATRRDLAIVLGLAAILRMANLMLGSSDPGLALPVMDAADYDALARSFLGQPGGSTPPFWQPILYPLVLAGIYAVTDGSTLAARIVQAGLGVAVAGLGVIIGRRLGGPRVGLVAGILLATNGPLLFFESRLLATGWATFWVAGLVAVGLTHHARPGPRSAGLLGLVSALAILTRPVLASVVIVGAVALVLAARSAPGRGRARSAAIAVAGFLVVAVPAILASQAVTGRASLVPASGGLNLYIGNNPDWTRTVAARPGEEWDALATLTGEPDMWTAQAAYLDRVGAYVRDEPGRFLRGLVEKGMRVVSARELPRSFDVYTHREWSPVLAALVWKVGGFGFPFGLLLPLAVVGIGLRARDRRVLALAALALAYAATLVLVFPAARFRIPILPVLLPLAALGVDALWRAGSAGEIRRLAAGVGTVGLLAVLISVPGPFPEERHAFDAELHRFVASRHWQEGRRSMATPFLEEANRRSPGDPEILSALGEAYVHEGRLAEGMGAYEQAIALDPSRAGTHALVGAAWLGAGRPDDAVAALRRAAALDPTSVEILSNLGAALQRAGDLPAAIATYERALVLVPGDPRVLQNLGAARLQLGDPARAREILARAMEAGAGGPDVGYLLGLAELQLGRQTDALTTWRTVLGRWPDHAPTREAMRRLAPPGR